MVLLLWVKGGKHYTISVPANSNNAYLMKNDEWSLQVNIKKTDSETGNQIAADAQYEIFQWDTVTGKYQPTGGYNTYSVQRQGDGTYAVINSAAYATTDSMRHTLYYTQRNTGKFIIVESKAPKGYFGDWTDINHPGIVNTPLGKRGYYIEITKDSDNSVIWLDNADYNADIAATDKGGTKLATSMGVETTVTIYDTAKDPRRTYNTDNSGKAANEDSYTITPSDGVMKNDRTLGEISISKVDLDAVRYVGGSAAPGTALASGQAHGDAALDGAVYDLYAAEDITHPDGVTGVVDYSKIVDADGNPIWHTTIRDNSGQWVSDYLPVLKKDHLVASAKIENGWLCFSNLYLGKYYVVERSTGVVIPLRDGALVVSSTYPTVDSRTKAATGQTAALAKNGSGQYTDWVYKNQFSTVSKGKALDGSWTYDAYYLSFADGYLVDEQRSAIDFERKIVTISRTFERINVDGKMVDVSKCRTKNKSSFRSLPLIPAVEQALLKAQKRQRQQMKLCGNSYCKEYKDYICVDDMGHLVTPDYVTRVFREMLLKNGFRPIRYHDLRHSCASLLIKNKVTMKEVQMWLGHSSFSTTANIYAHIDVDSKMEAANMIASKINLGELPEKKKSPKRKIA